MSAGSAGAVRRAPLSAIGEWRSAASASLAARATALRIRADARVSVARHDASVQPLGELWIYVADTSCRGYSPLYDRICRAVAVDDELLGVVQQAPPEGHLPILLLAAVHYLVLGGVDHPIAEVYAGRSDAEPGALFIDFCLERQDELLELLATRHVNTNEVGRSAILGPALTTVAHRLGDPLAHLDVGCSAGLNLLADHYRLDYGLAGTTGSADASVRVDCEVIGGSPPIAPQLPPVVRRVGLDRVPVDVHDEDQARWQLACAWPDSERLPRARAAHEVARETPLDLIEGDAVDDVGDVLANLPSAATAVVTTTWVVAYFSPSQRIGFRDELAAASRTRPIAWVSAENRGVVEWIPGDGAPTDGDGVELSVLGLVTFRDGVAEAELLGYVHPHGSSIDWHAESTV